MLALCLLNTGRIYFLSFQLSPGQTIYLLSTYNWAHWQETSSRSFSGECCYHKALCFQDMQDMSLSGFGFELTPCLSYSWLTSCNREKRKVLSPMSFHNELLLVGLDTLLRLLAPAECCTLQSCVLHVIGSKDQSTLNLIAKFRSWASRSIF